MRGVRSRPRWTAWLVAACLLALLPGTACARQADAGADPGAALRAGRYEEAIAGYQRRVAADPADAASRRALVRALAEVGRYEEAARAARDAGDEAALANPLGEVLLARGDLAGAEAAFRRAAQGGAPDSLAARLNLALLLQRRGARDEAMRAFDGFIDVYNRSASLSAPELTAVATAVAHLGARDPRLFQDALRAYDEAIAADPADPEPRIRLAGLFLDRYNSPDAHETLREVLAANPSHPRALLALARARHFDGEADAAELVRRSLEVNPSLVPARVLLARLLLDQEQDAAAEAEVRRALEVDPASLEALGTLAAIHYLRGDQAAYRQARDRVLELNPGYADLYVALGEMVARRRRYQEAVDLARQAVALDSASSPALALLGLNQLRRGRVDEARASLDRAFAGDPYNVWVKNTLDLLDTYPRYRTVRTPRFELVLHGDEADLLAPYATVLAEEAYDRLAERYGHRAETPVRVEIYPNHADFSVRSVGLAGLGALGVAFGNVLALDSPSARERGQFHWGSTLWHEIAHAVTLGLSRHRVPRWLTEGISVLEERAARPGWGSETSPEFLLAYGAGELPPPSRLSEAFVRPASPQALGHAYHLSSLVAEWIEQRHGLEALRGLLRGYGEGRSTDELFRSVLRTDAAGLDRDFDAWLRERYAPQLAALGRVAPGGAPGGEYGARMAAARRGLEAGREEEAKRSLERAAEIFPVTLGGMSPYSLLADIHLRQGDTLAAAGALERLALVEESDYDANLRLAALYRSLGDAAGEARALERAVWIYPLETEPHARLAELYSGLGDHAGAVRERRAVVALRPVDRAEALYRLALALLDAGDPGAARAEVLRALEEAPGFAAAQELLLRLSEPREDS